MWFCDWCLEACNYLFTTINNLKKRVIKWISICAAKTVIVTDLKWPGLNLINVRRHHDNRFCKVPIESYVTMYLKA